MIQWFLYAILALRRRRVLHGRDDPAPAGLAVLRAMRGEHAVPARRLPHAVRGAPGRLGRARRRHRPAARREPVGVRDAVRAGGGPIVVATALLVMLGMIGAAAAVVRVVRVDPLTALGRPPMTSTTPTRRVRVCTSRGRLPHVRRRRTPSPPSTRLVSLDVEPGELLAVVEALELRQVRPARRRGRPDPPDLEAQVSVGGTDLTSVSSAGSPSCAARIGFVFQSGNLVPALAAIDQCGSRCTSAASPTRATRRGCSRRSA